MDNEEALEEFLNILEEAGLDLDDLGIHEDDLDELDVDDMNEILENLDAYIDEDEEEEED